MTQEEIKEITDKLEQLLIRFEATLSFEERQTWTCMWRLLDHFDTLERHNEALKAKNQYLEGKIMENFSRYPSPSVHS